MEALLKQLEAKKSWKNFIKTQCRRNGVDAGYANAFTIVKMRKFWNKLPSVQTGQQLDQTCSKQRIKSSVWLQNELKAFQWLLIVESGLKGKLIENFGKSEWEEMSSLLNKQQRILEYEAIKLIHERENHKRIWEEQEVAILQSILKEDPDNNKWNEVARKLFDLSNKKYFRSGKQCRERWFNHLDPEKKHGQWQDEEDRLIVEYILEKGRKWSQIAKRLEKQRTQHMIKNRFKTILIRLKKKYSEIKNQTHLLEQYMKEEVHYNKQKVDDKQSKVNGQDPPVREREGEDHDLNLQNCEEESLDRVPQNFKQCQIHQVVTPCPVIYQSFTPTFLNTPHALPFLINYSFDHFQKNQNLFLKNN